MLPKTIIHNVISLDGAVTGFPVDLENHYAIADTFGADAKLIGSATADSGIAAYTDGVPEEKDTDFIKPRITEDDHRPYWVIPDTSGRLMGKVHVFRRFEYCKDVIMILSAKTPESYASYLMERNYEIIYAGEDSIDFHKVLEILNERYQCKTIITDSGGTLNRLLLEEGLVDEISLLISPVITGTGQPRLFSQLQTNEKNIKLELLGSEVQANKEVHVRYKVIRD